MQVRIKINPKQNTVYVRDEVRESLGYEWNFNLDNGVGIVYPANMNVREAIRRVKLNLEGLELKPEGLKGVDQEILTKG